MNFPMVCAWLAALAVLIALAQYAFRQRNALTAANERKAQLERIVRTIPVNLAVWENGSEKLIAFTDQLARLYGGDSKTAPQIDPATAALQWEDYSGLAAAIEETRTLGEIRQFEGAVIGRGEPSRRIFRLVVYPIHRADGELVEIGLVAFDVTRERRAQAEMIEARRQIGAFFDNVPVSMAVHDLDGSYVIASQQIAVEYGITMDDLLCQSMASVAHMWPQFDDMLAAVGRVFGEGTQERMTVPFQRNSEAPIQQFDMVLFPIRNADGDIVQLGALGIDVTYQVEAGRALSDQRAQAHQSEKLAALGQLLAGVAHELNNPLTVVVGRSAILGEKLAGSPHEKALREIREAADRCSRIVKTFLAMARQSAPRRSTVQVNDLVEAALEMVAYNLRTGGIDVVMQLDPEMPDIEADEDQLVQVFTNLIINANHALQGVESARLTIATRVRDGVATIEVADNGPGVPGELAARIFEPFFTTKSVGEGTGMGLAMAAGILEEHGGSLAYRDAAGGGASFTVSLPLGIATAAPPPEPEVELPPPAERARVLIIDDEPELRAMLGEILSRVNFEAVECGNGAEAARAIEAQEFDLIICDVRMPVMDGVRFREHLAEHRPDLLERLLFMSGDVLQRSGERYATIAAHPIIDKPFRPGEVRALALSSIARLGVRT